MIRRLVKQTLIFFKIDWIDTLRINLFCLPFRQGYKFPILLFHSRLHLGRGKVEICVPNNRIRFGMIKLGINYAKNVFTNTGIQIDIRSSGKLIFHGSGIMGNGSNIVTRYTGTIEFGHNFSVSGNFSCCSFQHIVLGSNLSCSWDVSIYDTDFHETTHPDTGQIYTMTQPVTIGNNVWLCQKCTILKGAYIPQWTTVGALALVNKNFSYLPPYSVLVGAPAKPIARRLQRSDQSIIAQTDDWSVTAGLSLLTPMPNK